jgi:hypothetical protein
LYSIKETTIAALPTDNITLYMEWSGSSARGNGTVMWYYQVNNITRIPYGSYRSGDDQQFLQFYTGTSKTPYTPKSYFFQAGVRSIVTPRMEQGLAI